MLLKIYEVTSSAVATSFLWISFALPAVIIGPFASVYVDVSDKRKVLVITNLLQALSILGYALIHKTFFLTLYISVIIYSFLNQFYMPAELSLVPTLVKKKELPHANSLFFMTQQISIILGFGLAGIANRFLGYSTMLYLSSVFLGIAFVSVLFLPSFKKVLMPGSLSSKLKKYMAKIWEGYNFLFARKDVYLPLSLMVSFQAVLAILMVNIPILSEYILRLDPDLGGIGIVIPAGIGTIFGAYIVPKMLRAGFRKRRLIGNSLLGMSGAFFVLSYIVPNSYLIPGLLAAIILVMAVGFCYVGTLIPSQTYIQEVTPPGLRARIFGSYWIITTSMSILPVLLSGVFIKFLGIINLLYVISFLLVIGFILITKRKTVTK